MFIAAEILYTQTANEAIGSGSVAYSLGDADATHAAGTAVVVAQKSLKRIFSKEKTSRS
jgi:hypothetical protein